MQMKNKWNSYKEIFPVLLDYQLAGYTLLFLMNNNKQLLDEVFVISGIIKVEVLSAEPKVKADSTYCNLD